MPTDGHIAILFDLDGTLTLPVHDFGVIRSALGVPDGADILGHLAALSEEEARPLHQRLDGLERELAAWNARLSRAGDLPRKVSRSARIEHRKRILVSDVRRRNIERRLSDMRASEARFSALRPGLLLLWKVFTAGVEKAEA